MITALSIVAAVLAVSALIVLHEAGHMWVARALGMKVEKFSVGFGPVLWSATRGETEYAVSALPLGGYVRIRGMAAGDDVAADDASAYCNQAAWRRVLVLLAGPGANYLIAVALAAGLLGTMGLPTPDGAARVGDLVAGMPAERAGLRPGDRILAVAGAPVATWTELVGALQKAPGRTIELAVERGEGPAEHVIDQCNAVAVDLGRALQPDSRAVGAFGVERTAQPIGRHPVRREHRLVAGFAKPGLEWRQRCDMQEQADPCAFVECDRVGYRQIDQDPAVTRVSELQHAFAGDDRGWPTRAPARSPR